MITFPISSPVIFLVGPTAIGKTALSLDLARKFDCEIISMDSMQVYRFMDIGTAKVTEAEMGGIPHYLIDIVDPDEEYDAQQFVNDSLEAIDSIVARGKIPLITGGTGLYLKALVEGLFLDIGDYPVERAKLKLRAKEEGVPKLHEELVVCDCITAKRVHRNDTHRILRALEIYHGTGVPWSEHLRLQQLAKKDIRFANCIQVALTRDRELLYDRINLRTKIMMESGLIGETENLLDMGYGPNLKSMGAIGYRHAVQFLEGKMTRNETEMALARDTRRYAKRQYTWFNGIDVLQWFDVSHSESIVNSLDVWLKGPS